MSKTIAIYHKDCTDGTTAAAVVLKKFPDALVFPLSHGFEEHELDEILNSITLNDMVFTVDCVIGVKELLAKGFKVTSLDHHIGVKEEMQALSTKDKNFTFIFDNTKSGASLSWSYFFPNEKVPELIAYVEDADLWTWKYGSDTKDVGNSLFFLTNKPEEIVKLFGAPLEAIKKEGAVISKYNDYMIGMAVDKTEPIYIQVGTHRVPLYNITILKSESGNKLTTLRGETVGLFSIDGNKVKISFRSLTGQKPSALDIAQLLGGGGHVNASGAGMHLDEFIKALVK